MDEQPNELSKISFDRVLTLQIGNVCARRVIALSIEGRGDGGVVTHIDAGMTSIFRKR